jgi:hypothetical protein
MDEGEPAVESAWVLRIGSAFVHGMISVFAVNYRDNVYSGLIERTRVQFSAWRWREVLCNVRYAVASGIRRSPLTIYIPAVKSWRTVGVSVSTETSKYPTNAKTLVPHLKP